MELGSLKFTGVRSCLLQEEPPRDQENHEPESILHRHLTYNASYHGTRIDQQLHSLQPLVAEYFSFTTVVFMRVEREMKCRRTMGRATKRMPPPVCTCNCMHIDPKAE
ncbi:hypothetical protein PENCOP_c007G04177 [Penicillium coprophilum]|uniref:Uncharacterized protein n=1 Tax=Penicillium coprophilum TaxID=36646 RepID=A0A1V6UMI3_9EURO|nr:hypothetical protein PENCOP_c007G04177 [Penicillium coprophilum]